MSCFCDSHIDDYKSSKWTVAPTPDFPHLASLATPPTPGPPQDGTVASNSPLTVRCEWSLPLTC